MITSAIWNQDVSANIIALSRALLVPEHQSGQYYTKSGISATGATIETANILWAMPIYIPATGSYDRIAIEITTIAVGNVRLGIYADSGGLPGALIADLGTLSTNTLGVIPLVISPSQSLSGPALYWLASVFSATPSVRTCVGIGLDPVSATQFNNLTAGVSKVFAYGALPNPFGTPSASAGNPPVTAIRKA